MKDERETIMGNLLNITRLQVKHIDDPDMADEMYASVFDDHYSFTVPINKIEDQEIGEQIDVLPEDDKELFLAIYLHACIWANFDVGSLDFVLDIENFSGVSIRGNFHNMEEINQWIEELPEED
jgi:hypothetical protein